MAVVFWGVLLCGCSTTETSRKSASDFRLAFSSSFDNSAYQKLSDCLTDGFREVPQNIMINHFVSIEDRDFGKRIEIRNSLVPQITYVSVDVYKKGIAEYFEVVADFNNISKIREKSILKFKECFNGIEEVNKK